jgi:hypothetical protein
MTLAQLREHYSYGASPHQILPQLHAGLLRYDAKHQPIGLPL